MLDQRVRESKDGGIANVEYITRAGKPVDEIVNESESTNYDLVVMASSSITSKVRVLGSNVRRVLDSISRPVLVIHEWKKLINKLFSNHIFFILPKFIYVRQSNALISSRWAPGEGLEPSSPEGHQLARHSLCDNIHMISRLTPFRAYSDLPSLGTPALLIFEHAIQFIPLKLFEIFIITQC